MIITLAITVTLSKLLETDFGLQLGDTKRGMAYIKVYTVAFAIFTLICHILMYTHNMLPAFVFPLEKNSVLCTLSFQLLLSGTSKEIIVSRITYYSVSLYIW